MSTFTAPTSTYLQLHVLIGEVANLWLTGGTSVTGRIHSLTTADSGLTLVQVGEPLGTFATIPLPHIERVREAY